MKKIIIFLCVLSFSIFLVSCSKKDNTKDFKIGLALDQSGIDDRSFNQSAWEAIVQFANENNIPISDYTYSNATNQYEYIPTLSNYAKKDLSLVVVPGFVYKEPLKTVAQKYPDQKFLLLSAELNEPNVAAITFAANEGSFLVGVIAALKAKDAGYSKIGFLGGMDIPTVRNFEAGFVAGIKMINPNIQIVIEYANNFGNPELGKKLANKMFSEGCKIIFNVAGGTGNGSMDEARNRALNGEDVWIIGVDTDQYRDGIYKSGKSVVLTSMIKNIKLATYNTLQAVKNNTFKGGHIVYTLKDGGVKLPDFNPNLKKEWLEQLEIYKKDIISGKISVPSNPTRVKK